MRKCQEFGLVRQYRQDENVKWFARALLALAYVPQGDIVDGFEWLAMQAPDSVEPLYEYFERNYIGYFILMNYLNVSHFPVSVITGALRRARRAAPRFPHDQWNIEPRIEAGLPATNNRIEGWHSAFNATLQCSHPTVFRLVTSLRKEHSKNSYDYQQCSAREINNKYITPHSEELLFRSRCPVHQSDLRPFAKSHPNTSSQLHLRRHRFAGIHKRNCEQHRNLHQLNDIE